MRDNSLTGMFAGTFPQMLAVLSGTISAISDGMQYGWSAPFIPILKREDSPVKISEFDEEFLESIYMYGGVCGLPVTILLVDKIGRKYSVLAAACTSLTAWILMAIADHVIYLYVARFMTGLAGDVAFVAAPMYIAEIADQKIRGFLAGIIYLMMLVGILVVYSVAPFIPIYATCIVGSAFLLIQLITFPFMPESPYYLLSKEKFEKAKKALRRLRTTESIDKELEEISAAVKRQRSEKGRPQDLFLVKSNRRALTIMMVLNAAQHFSSISVMLMNLHTILEEAGSIYVSSTTAAIIFAAVMLIAATIADFTVDKFGRKGLLTTSSLLTGLSLLVLAIYFNLKNSGYDVKGVSWIPIAAVMVYAGVFKIGLGIVPIVMTAELFPSKLKAMGMTIADACYLVFAVISIQIYQALYEGYGMEWPFYIFAASCLLTAAFSFFYIPETRGKTLDEIQFILKGEPIPRRASVKSNGSIENGIKTPEVMDSHL